MKLRIYLDVADPVTRRRLAALLHADAEVALVGSAREADVVVGDQALPAIATGNGTAVADGTALTDRELSVLRLVALGMGNKEIAAELGISRHTVKYHLAAVLTKLGVHSRTEAVALALRRGMVPL